MNRKEYNNNKYKNKQQQLPSQRSIIIKIYYRG